MGKSCVYNSGSTLDSKKKNELWFDYGVLSMALLTIKKTPDCAGNLKKK